MDRGYETRIDYEYIGKCDLVDSVCGDVDDLCSIDWCILFEHMKQSMEIPYYLEVV